LVAQLQPHFLPQLRAVLGAVLLAGGLVEVLPIINRVEDQHLGARAVVQVDQVLQVV
jgi:hypothetical protein